MGVLFFDDKNIVYYGVKSEKILTFMEEQKHGNDSNIINIVVSGDRRNCVKLHTLYSGCNIYCISYIVGICYLQMDNKIKDKTQKWGTLT